MIGVFDSGLGGLSVLAAIAHELPKANFIYLADTAHVPYGDKPDHFITGRVLAIGNHLSEQGCKLIVVACNTATTTAIQSLRDHLPHIPIVGVEPGVKPAARGSLSRKIAVLATETTARSKRLTHLIETHAAHVETTVVSCPGWATHVETLQPDTPAFRSEIANKIEPLIASGIDRIVLGCTHYAFLIPLIEPMLHGKAQLIDVASAVARQVLRLRGDSHAEGHLHLQATSHPERLAAALPALGLQPLAKRIRSVEAVSV